MANGGNLYFIPPEYYGLVGFGQGLGQLSRSLEQRKEDKRTQERHESDQALLEQETVRLTRENERAQAQREAALRALADFDAIVARTQDTELARAEVGPIAMGLISQEFFSGTDPVINYQAGALGLEETEANIAALVASTSLTSEEIQNVRTLVQERQQQIDQFNSFVEAVRATGKTIGQHQLEFRDAELENLKSETDVNKALRERYLAEIEAIRAEAAATATPDAKLLASTVEAIYSFTHMTPVDGKALSPQDIRNYLLTGGAGLTAAQRDFLRNAHQKVMAETNAGFVEAIRSAGPETRQLLDAMNAAVQMKEAGIIDFDDATLQGMFLETMRSVYGRDATIGEVQGGFFNLDTRGVLQLGPTPFADILEMTRDLAPPNLGPELDLEAILTEASQMTPAQLTEFLETEANPAVRELIEGLLVEPETPVGETPVASTPGDQPATLPGRLGERIARAFNSELDETAHLRREPPSNNREQARALEEAIREADRNVPLATDPAYAAWARQRRALVQQLDSIRVRR